MSLSRNTVYVNRSNTNIPIYDTLVQNEVGDQVAGGTRIAVIYPSECYTAIEPAGFMGYAYYVCVRDAQGDLNYGYMTIVPLSTYPEEAYVKYQEPFHRYNSNGSALSASKYESTLKMYVFTVKKHIPFVDVDGVHQGVISPGTLLATDTSTSGSSMNDHMLFRKRKNSGGQWRNLVNDSYKYGYVDMSYASGTMPNNRAIY